MDPFEQSNKCDTQIRLIEMDKEWTLKLTHRDITSGGGPVQQLVEHNANRVKLTICNRTPYNIVELGQIGDPALFVGIPLYAQNQTFPNPIEGVYIIERNVEDDKAECTGAWYASGLAGTCFYISEVIYTGNTRKCLTIQVEDSCDNECCPSYGGLLDGVQTAD